jgi:exodeoxyribonuclease VII large subunit
MGYCLRVDDDDDRDRILSVSQLTNLVKDLLEDSFSQVRVEGEISNLKPASSGHYYFNLKDRDAMLQAVMFKGRARSLGFAPTDGMLVRATGTVTVYQARGQYQLLVERLERAGQGDILALLEDRKRRLASEGLFDDGRKRALPRFPARIAVITSPTGAAIRDILTVLGRRHAGIAVTVIPSAVQGEAAPRELVRGLRLANRWSLGDVIILGRGGGSLEDLLAFSDEAVVRAVAASDIPVISAVGHEIDWALTDYAADLRAATPSAAAELVSESREAIRATVAQLAGELETVIVSRLGRHRATLERFEPGAIEGRFMRLLHPALRAVDEARDAIVNEIGRRLAQERHRLELSRGLMEASSPEAVLARGYSIIRLREGGALVRSSADLSAGELLDLRFATGIAIARVEERKA